MNPILAQMSHRPWPLPAGRYTMEQTWRDLLFAHWPVPAELIRELVPPQLELDLYNGAAWIGVVPFSITDIQTPFLPPIPALSRFEELNVRTYVSHGGKDGVYFFSLDAASRWAVAAARQFYKLPYFYARMKSVNDRGTVSYNSHRIGSSAQLVGTYRATDEVQVATPGTLEHFVTERYCLYAVWKQNVYRCEIHHLPWPLQNAEAELSVNTVAASDGITLPVSVPILHFASELKVFIWPLRRC